MADRVLDPSGNMYDSFMKIIQSITIKYFSKAQKFETMESKMKADGYIDAKNKLDTFFTYTDYSDEEYAEVGIYDLTIIAEAKKGNLNAIPVEYRDSLLVLRRQREIDFFEEQNNYYRMLNGLPDLDDKEFYYVSSVLSREYGIDPNIPIHKIQDYYNKESDGKGDYLISIIDGTGYIDKLIEEHPDKTYLRYIGPKRIDICTSRSAKNFQIIQIKKPNVRQSILDIFVRIYEQCREYYVKTIYMSNYAKFIEYYDNFIALCIMIMTLQQISVKQITLGIKRDFFDIFAIKTLYETYDIPYNLSIDEDTQADIVQNLNMLIQNKATDKVLYNIANLLGFTNINIYKYYLTKEHKMNIYDVPIFKYTERFNSDTGEVEVVPDYKAMYDLYFQKYELKNEDFINSFNEKSNRVEYDSVVTNDAFWWDDQHVFERLWESEYNFVESKYLSLGISYSMTEIMFENIIFLKMIMQQEDKFKNINLRLPRILENEDIPIFDVIVLMLCITAAKHKLWGEIITVPTQVIAVNDYIENTERGGAHNDTFRFNYDYFFNPEEFEDKQKMDDMKDTLIDHINSDNKDDKLVNAISYNFDYFSMDNADREKHINEIKNILGEEDYEKFEYYVEKVSIVSGTTQSEKIKSLNDMFYSIKGLHKLLSFYMTKTDNMEIYTSLKTIYHSLFLSKEMCDTFEITMDVEDPDSGEVYSHTRTAWTYFEFLYHRNPKLYNSIFEFNMEDEYQKYLEEHGLDTSDMSFTEFSIKVAEGEIFLNYGKLIVDDAEESVRDDTLYFYVNHIISRLEIIIDDLKFLYLMNDISTPLEKLLMQLVRFFKSYTVDILDLDTLYVCDFKIENTVRLFDKIHYIWKLIQMDENLNLSYSDTLNKIISTIDPEDRISLNDKVFYDVLLIIDELYGNKTAVVLDELISNLEKDCSISDDSMMKITDVLHVNSYIPSNDNCKLSDEVFKLWYSD